mmetsp:Transcript_13679/g.31569  ORF Transcript_13679/g.31569 Transcript_13679/m.31569 type:complete len:230 (-) Transcript_13679:279-968(-)
MPGANAGVRESNIGSLGSADHTHGTVERQSLGQRTTVELTPQRSHRRRLAAERTVRPLHAIQQQPKLAVLPLETVNLSPQCRSLGLGPPRRGVCLLAAGLPREGLAQAHGCGLEHLDVVDDGGVDRGGDGERRVGAAGGLVAPGGRGGSGVRAGDADGGGGGGKVVAVVVQGHDLCRFWGDSSSHDISRVVSGWAKPVENLDALHLDVASRPRGFHKQPRHLGIGVALE